MITVRPYINISINSFSFPRRDTSASVRGAQPADVRRCRVSRRGRWHAYHWRWAESGAGRHGGRRLASVRAEIHFNITSQWEVPEIFVWQQNI